MTLPIVPPIQNAAYGLRCPNCGRAAMLLRPQFLHEYSRGNIHISEQTVYHDKAAPYQHTVKDGDPITCQWCGSVGVLIHTSALGQFTVGKDGSSVEEKRFIEN